MLQKEVTSYTKMSSLITAAQEKTTRWGESIQLIGKDSTVSIESIRNEMESYANLMADAGLETQELQTAIQQFDGS
jgi:hypothetical protein